MDEIEVQSEYHRRLPEIMMQDMYICLHPHTKHTYIHTYIHTHIHTHTYIHTHIHTHIIIIIIIAIALHMYNTFGGRKSCSDNSELV